MGRREEGGGGGEGGVFVVDPSWFCQTIDRGEQMDHLKMLLQLSSESNLGETAHSYSATCKSTCSLACMHTHTHYACHRCCRAATPAGGFNINHI